MELHPDFPVKEGKCRLTRDCELELPEKFNWRIEDGNMVFWRPGLTFWIAVWGRESNRTTEETLEWIRDDASPDRTNELVERSGDVIRFTYCLDEKDPDRKPESCVSVIGYVIGPPGHVQISAYCDDARSAGVAENVIRSVRWLPEPT